MSAYYNENNRHAARRLRQNIASGLVAPGDVDERSIVDIRPNELDGYTQCHFFAGIGIWSAARRGAGWPDNRPVWTGSCPCQPFSGAGQGRGFADERHLWPAWFHLIEQCEPPAVLGEQTSGTAASLWLQLVSADLEACGYAFRVDVTPAASVGAPHGRHRSYWVADADGRYTRAERQPAGRQQRQFTQDSVALLGLGNATSGGCREQRCPLEPWGGRLRHFDCSGHARGFWSDADIIPCKDGFYRPVEPGTFPLVDGAPARMERLRQFGNGLVLPQATEFVTAWMDCAP